jgi:hypothetical protein
MRTVVTVVATALLSLGVRFMKRLMSVIAVAAVASATDFRPCCRSGVSLDGKGVSNLTRQED